MRIAVISDQLSDDLEEAIQIGTLLELNTYELRWVRPPGGLRIRRIGELADSDATSLAAAARRYGATFSAISTDLFHSRWVSDELADHLHRLERFLRLAELFGAQNIVVHGFLPPEGRRNGVCPPGVIDALGQATKRAQEAGFRLLLRNASDSYADTGAHTASIVHAVHSPGLGVSWDPCQAARVGERAISDGYEWVAPFVGDVSVRDQVWREGLGFEYATLGEGDMEWLAQLRALIRDGYQGTITLGSQLEPRLLSTLHSLETLRKLLKKARGGGPVQSNDNVTGGR